MFKIEATKTFSSYQKRLLNLVQNLCHFREKPRDERRLRRKSKGYVYVSLSPLCVSARVDKDI